MKISEIKRIYIEETGKEPPAHITIYSFDDFKNFKIAIQAWMTR
ncbi:DUF6792 domain-containing protein [Thermaerobacillus caldiproteolyticus]|nr:DUF6792 domain-containing protein [Anoxybacillus caldiproteolyticus]